MFSGTSKYLESSVHMNTILIYLNVLGISFLYQSFTLSRSCFVEHTWLTPSKISIQWHALARSVRLTNTYSEAQEVKNESIRSDSPLDISQFRLRGVE